jgi:hypothetical protein
MPAGMTGPPYHWRTYIQGPGPPGLGLDARLMTVLCKEIDEIQRSEN